ncbi:sugar ABC transporter permease [Pullulanibacillus camelliae]|uniref:Sugar ABC transporter permease n=1 Tax=Pullulanibacillus camelliae TaxID=1707096 RepID=A0A8J2YFT4_9BACL|nr:sugar ABC transporter permease [Pullulanibacillus camelliae]GGE31400.1 sugar ABC transporter permease [Pullulanibacillus camelliae]
MKKKIHLNPGAMYVTPAVIVIALVMLFPLVYTFYLSFNESSLYSTGLKFVGFSQYVKLFQDHLFVNSLKATFYWTFGSVVFQFLLGFFVAVVLNQKFIRYRSVLRIFIMIPWVLPSIIGVNVWKWAYHPDFGIINYFLKSMGLISHNITWLSGAHTALLSTIIVNVWKMFPLVMLMIEASLQSVPEHLKDAAKVDGANMVRTFFTVTVPHISSTCYTIIMLLVIWTLNSFVFVYALTGGGPAHSSEVMSMYVYKYAFENYNFGLAAAASVVLFLITVVFALIYALVTMKGEGER